MTSPARLTGRPAPFHGPLPADARPRPLHRPESHPDLQRFRSSSVSRSPSSGNLVGDAPSKLLWNVTVQGSVGAVHVVMSPESTVEELVEAAVEEYVKEGRLPLLADNDPRAFELHYSSFSLESKLWVPKAFFLFFLVRSYFSFCED